MTLTLPFVPFSIVNNSGCCVSLSPLPVIVAFTTGLASCAQQVYLDPMSPQKVLDRGHLDHLQFHGVFAQSSKAQTLAAIKSLLAFAHKIGYIPFNVGAALQLPK